jgi:hypothetical protein
MTRSTVTVSDGLRNNARVPRVLWDCTNIGSVSLSGMLLAIFGGLGNGRLALTKPLEVADRSVWPQRRVFAEPDEVGARGGEDVLDVGLGQAVVAAVNVRFPRGVDIPDKEGAGRGQRPVLIALDTADLAGSAINEDPVLRRLVVEDHLSTGSPFPCPGNSRA